ncbi:MAG: SDR family oxidoreductase [Acidobacteriia bacterium]|nr:SDR family oxidoreductase [Terriglobia bacterium]
MDLGIQDRVAVVTAASRGMGRAIAEALAAEGCKLAICSRDPDAIAAAAEAIRGGRGTEVFHKAVDVSDIDALRAFVAKARGALGPVSIAVANAGGPPGGRFEDFAAEDWQAAFRLNFLSTWALIESVLPDMRAQRWGRVVSLTSTSVRQPIEGLILSNGVRASVVGMLKTLAAEYGSENILFNNAGPGLIATDRLLSLAQRRADAAGIARDEMIERLASQTALRRVGQPEEFAAVVAFLCSEQASYVTGSSLMIDGGLVKAV